MKLGVKLIVMKKWIENFKLALIQEDVLKLENLIDKLDLKAHMANLSQNVDEFENSKENSKEELRQIQALIQEAIKLLSLKKDTQALEIQKFQKAMKYIKA